MRKFLTAFLSLLLLFPTVVLSARAKEETIRWVDFTPTCAALQEAAALDISAHESGGRLSWIELLACYAATHGGRFSSYRTGALNTLAQTAQTQGLTFAEIAHSRGNAKQYGFYLRAYQAVLSGMLGEYRAVRYENGKEIIGEKQYGVCAASPIAKGYSVTEYHDFGTARSYGYRRRHLGHDILGSVGTPICAVESGYVEALGWNQYGGWRIGIRSFDGKRYYYYAHLRKDAPYEALYPGKIVNAGEVIGYMGMTGYSTKENVNNIDIPHLHIGLELIFSPEQKDGYCQIWISLDELSRFWAQYAVKTERTAAKSHRAQLYFLRADAREQ